MIEYITVLGSCRQWPIANHFSTSSIQMTLNFPHYTKEILQQILYLKYRNIPDEYTNYCFRHGLLNYCTKGVDDSMYSSLKEEFDKTTTFVIEIASRISYEWNGLYLHHISTEEQYNFYDRNNITIRDLTNEEIEEDLIKIRDELYPKKILIVSHFSTYNHGKRYELIQLLQHLTTKLDLPFLNQTNMIEKHGANNILHDEYVLTHYNDNGNYHVGLWLADKIREMIHNETNKKLLCQVYYTDEERVAKYTFHGFGDFIRGCIYLYQVSRNTNLTLKINFSHHLLNHFFVCKQYLSLDECKNTTYVFSEHMNIFDYNNIFCNRFEDKSISDDCKQFIINHCFTPKISFQNTLNEIKTKLNLIDKQYYVIHIRLHDDDKYNFNRHVYILNNIHSIANKHDENSKFLLIASNNTYLPYINYPFIIKTNLERGHMGMHVTSLQQTKDTMIEFMLMTTCIKIYQLSVYSWGSGFSDTINKIYDIDIEKFNI